MDLNNSFANRSFTAGDIYTGQPSNVTGLSNTIKVAYHGVNGVLRIYQSPNGKLWSYYEEFDIVGNSFAQSGINGNYYYIQYTHGLGTNTITMATNVSQQIHNNFAVSLTAQDIVTVDGLLFDGDGALIVTGGGGGGGGTASSGNQELQIDEAILTNTKLDTINTSLGSLATSANQSTLITGLDSVVNYSQQIENNTHTYSASPVHLDLELQGSTIWADSTLPWTAPTNGENGWRYNNTTIGGGQVYYYANAPALVTGSQEPDITLGSVSCGYFVANHRILIDNDPNHKFYASIYTQPTGSGDAQFWYHSRKVYQISPTQIMSKGADYLFFWGLDPAELRPDLEHIEMTLATFAGDCLPGEIVEFMGVNVDSQVPVNEFDGVVKQAGFQTAGGTSRVVQFDNSVARKAEYNLSQLSVGMGTLQVNMGGFTFNGDDELLVTKQTYVDIRSGGIDLTHTTNGAKECLDVQVNNIVACDTGAVVIASGSVTETNPITGFALESTLETIKLIMEDLVPTNLFGQISTGPTVNGPIAADIDGNMFVKIRDTVAVSGDVGLVQGTQVNLVDSTVGLVANTTVGITGDVAITSAAALLVTETAPLTGFSLEETQLLIKAQTEKLTFVDVDTNINNLKVFDLVNNAILSQFSFFTNEDTTTDLRVKVQNIIEVRNPMSEHLSVTESAPITGFSLEETQLLIQGQTDKMSFVDKGTYQNLKVEVDNAVSVQNATGTTLDVHCFGSADGATYHHLKTSATGELVTHSQTRDGSGTAITSTPNGGITALDVCISNQPVISGVVDTRAQTAFMPSVIENQNITGPVQMGTVVDIEHYLWVSAIMKFSSVTAGGNIYLEVSPDGSNFWARPSGAQVFINTSITNTTGAILLSSPVSMRYVRLWADTGFIGVSGTAYVCCK